jgi:hypothetical protein
MRHPIRPRRGSCLRQSLVGLTVLGLLLLIGGVVGMVTSGAGSAATGLAAKLESLVEHATVFEAPGTKQLELDVGGGIIALSPKGMVGDKRIGTPPADVTFAVTMTGPEGKPVKLEANNAPRNPTSPFEVLGAFELETKGLYTIDVKSSDGTTPAAIMVGAAGKDDVELFKSGITAVSQGLLGACGAGCGGLMFLAFGIPALIMSLRAKKQRTDPLEHV